jgi:transcriptional regulator with XRE-family HTH domain
VSYGAQLEHARLAAGLTVEQVAEYRRVHPTTIRRYETEDTVPTLDTLEDLAELYGVPVTQLYNPDDPTDPVTALEARLDAIVATAPPLSEDTKRQIQILLGLAHPPTEGDQP